MNNTNQTNTGVSMFKYRYLVEAWPLAALLGLFALMFYGITQSLGEMNRIDHSEQFKTNVQE